MDKKGTLASVATALASNVLPQPGGPKSKAPENAITQVRFYNI